MTKLIPVFTEIITDNLKPENLYISEKYKVAIHLCACGCGNKTVMPFDSEYNEYGWKLTNNNGLISFNPSVGNFQYPCKSHYFIVDNEIKWC